MIFGPTIYDHMILDPTIYDHMANLILIKLGVKLAYQIIFCRGEGEKTRHKYTAVLKTTSNENTRRIG